MKQIATVCALFALSCLCTDTASAQSSKPAVEYASVWNPQLNRWNDTVKTFEMSYTPEYTLTQRSGSYRTTYSGFVPVSGDVYTSRFYWDPSMTYSMVQIDSVHSDGATTTPVRLDQYDRTIPGRVAYTRSAWDGQAWVPVQTSIALTDKDGITTSVVNHAMVMGSLTLTDSTHAQVVRDLKGNVTSVKILRWTMQEPTLQPLTEQRYTLNGDGSIASAEIWGNLGGPELSRMMRMHDFTWVVRNKNFPYVFRDEGMDLFYGGDGWSSAKVDIWNGADWSEIYMLEQTFDDQERLTSYTFNGMTRDTFAFDNGLMSLNQSESILGTPSISKGSKTIYERDANGTLRSVTTQKFDLNTSSYINDRLYLYQIGPASVHREEDVAVHVYPNPAARELHVGTDSRLITAEIVSVTGETVLSTQSSRIDITELPPGTYGVRVQTESGSRTLKFIKAHE